MMRRSPAMYSAADAALTASRPASVCAMNAGLVIRENSFITSPPLDPGFELRAHIVGLGIGGEERLIPSVGPHHIEDGAVVHGVVAAALIDFGVIDAIGLGRRRDLIGRAGQ